MSADPLTIRSVALPPYIDISATVLFSITGAMMAIRRHYDAVGVFVLALACGLGGGLIRDGLFIQSGPPMAMRNGSYILAVLAGCVIAIVFFTHVERLSKPFLIMDALATGAYGVVGSSIAFEAGLTAGRSKCSERPWRPSLRSSAAGLPRHEQDDHCAPGC